MTYFHVNPIMGCLFYCYSTEADYEYYVRCENFDDVDKAMEIADRELSLWGAGNETYYYYSGYVEVVENAFKAAGIDAEFFVPLNKEEEEEK